MQPLISIVIANYNYGRFLETAIRSVLQQCDTEMRLPSGDRIELIIVDGGSTDSSVEIIQAFSDRLGGVRFWEGEEVLKFESSKVLECGNEVIKFESSNMRKLATANGANLANGGWGSSKVLECGSSKVGEEVTANGANLANGGQSAVRSPQLAGDGRQETGLRQSAVAVGRGSKDNFRTSELQNSRTSFLWCSEKDRGQSHAFNKGFARASGKFLTWLNADDVLLPGGLSAVAREMGSHPQCKWFVGSTLWLDESLRIVRCFRAHRFSVIRACWGGALSAGGPSSFFEKAMFERLGPIDEDMHFLMDIDLWCRLYFRGKVKYLRTTEYVWGYRIHKDSKMSGSDVAPDNEKNKQNRMAADREMQIILKRYGKKKDKGNLIQLCSVPLIDGLICLFETYKNRGRYAFENQGFGV